MVRASPQSFIHLPAFAAALGSRYRVRMGRSKDRFNEPARIAETPARRPKFPALVRATSDTRGKETCIPIHNKRSELHVTRAFGTGHIKGMAGPCRRKELPSTHCSPTHAAEAWCFKLSRFVSFGFRLWSIWHLVYGKIVVMWCGGSECALLQANGLL